MARASIIVFSETGFTRTYARWIAEETGIGILELGGILHGGNWGEDDLVLVGAPVHGGELAQAKRVRAVIDAANGARVICFATGLSEPDEDVVRRVKAASGISEDVPLHYYPGGFSKDRLSPANRTMITLYRTMMKHQRNAASNAELLLERTSHDGDYTDRGLIGPLVDEVRAFLEKAQ